MNFVTDVITDLRYTARQLRRSPALALVVILSLALGIGANTAIFSAVEAVMLRSLPLKSPDQLVMLKWSARDYPSRFLQDLEGSGGRSVGSDGSARSEAQSFSYRAFEYLRDHNHVFTGTFGISGNDLSLNVGLGGRAESAIARGVSGNYFQVLEVPAFIGRTILPEDDRAGAAAVGVASYAFWQSRMGMDAGVLGKSIVVNGSPLTVVGVAAKEFSGLTPGNSPDLWIPLHQYSAAQASLGNANNGVPFAQDPMTWWIQVAGRLKPGTTEAGARSEFDS